jgi:tetratricopeptide (TPR) repeat protein
VRRNRNTARLLSLGLLTTWLAVSQGCGPRLPAAYVEQSTKAREAYAAGDYEKAASHWQTAATTAPNAKYRDESLYRHAVSLGRAGRIDQAQRAMDRLARGAPGQRQARATFDRAYLLLRAGKEAQGLAALRAALLKHPNSGLALRATARLLEHARQSGGRAAERAELDDLLARLEGTEIHQLLAISDARWSDQGGDSNRALAAYRRVIDATPYPRGRYWDEAILRAAELHVELGQHEAAIGLLRWMLGHREQPDFVGSYDRHYARAHFKLAEIQRDVARDLEGARKEFLSVVSEYSHSLLRDDALWHAARCALLLGRLDVACDDARRLLESFPESRYAACAPQLCPELTAPGECHAYLLRAPSLEPAGH